MNRIRECRLSSFTCSVVRSSSFAIPTNLLWALLWWLWHYSSTTGTNFLLLPVVDAGPLYLQCDPCIDRSKVEIHVVLHGAASDNERFRTSVAMRQTSHDLGIQLHMDMPNTSSSEEMAWKINSLIRYKLDNSEHGHTHNVKQIDGLIVSIPDEIVQAAANDAVESGIHVWGFNTGYDLARDDPNILGYVAQDEYLAGVTATDQFIKRRLAKFGPPKKAIFINEDPQNSALKERFRGFNISLHAMAGIVVEELVVDPSRLYETILQIDDAIDGCQYDFVLLGSGGTETVKAVTYAFDFHGCDEYLPTLERDADPNGIISMANRSDAKRHMMIGVFDSSVEVLDAIASKQLEFALSPQRYLQSALPVLLSTIYASTGKRLVLPLEGAIFKSGPYIIDIDNIPSNAHLACEDEAFPICPRDGTIPAAPTRCPCTDRRKLRIAGVVHGLVGDPLWDDVFAAARQAAVDMEITLELERFEPGDSEEVLHDKMANKMRSLCGSGVDGIFVSMPSERLITAVQFCKKLGIPVININTGKNFALDLGIQYIGQLEYRAGMDAARRMLLSEMTAGYCIIPASSIDNADFHERCEGFRDYIVVSNATFGGIVYVPGSNEEIKYHDAVARAVGDFTGYWDGVGLLVVAGGIKQALYIQRHHQSVMLATFDVQEEYFAPLDDGRLLFAMDQQEFLQGSMAVYLLTYGAYTKQFLLNPVIETGPVVVKYSPSAAQQTCEELRYPVCTRVPEEDHNYIDSNFIIMGYALVGLLCLTGIIFLIWMHLYRGKNVVQASQPLFLVILVCGGIISTLAIIPFGAQTAYRYLQDPMTGDFTNVPNPQIPLVDACCVIAPWVYGIGFSIMFSALCAKIRRVKMIYNAGARMRRKQVDAKDVFSVMAIMFALEVTVLLCWTLLSPSQWKRTINIEVAGYVLESTGQCQSEHGDLFLLIQTLLHAVCLLYALALCWQTSDIPTEFAEGSYISLSILCFFQVSVLAIPVGWMVSDQSDVFYFVKCAVVFLPNFTVLCLIFVPKMWRVFSGDDQLPFAPVAGRGSTAANGFSRGNNNSTAQSPNIRTNFSTNNSTYGNQQAASSTAPRSESGQAKSTTPATFGSGVSENSSSKHSGVREAAPVESMAPIDAYTINYSEYDSSEDDIVIKPTVDPGDAYNHLKAGLDDDSSSSSSSSSDRPSSEAVIAAVGLGSLAAEISRAEQTREDVFISSVGETAPKVQVSKLTIPPPSFGSRVDESESTSSRLSAAKDLSAETNNPRPIRQYKRRGSPDVDSSPDSSENLNGFDPYNVGERPGGDVSSSSSESDGSSESSSSVGAALTNLEMNPQEGGSHDPSNYDSPNKDIMKDSSALTHTDHRVESESSTSTTAASTTGISKAEASKAEIFRKRHDEQHPETLIRLKKVPEDYAENATLAMSITKTPGTFLRKVAASFGSVSLSSATHPSSPPRKDAHQYIDNSYGGDIAFTAAPAANVHCSHPIADIKKQGNPEFQVERQHRPQYAALKSSFTSEEVGEDEKVRADIGNKSHQQNSTTTAAGLQPNTSEDADVFYFL